MIDSALAKVRLAWALVIAATWAPSLWLTYRAGFHPGLTIPRETIPPLPYPWMGVGRVVLQTAVYSLVAYLIVRNGGPRRAALGAAAALGVHILHVLAYGTDAPDFVYMPMRYALMLAAVLLVMFGLGIFGVGPAARRRAQA